MGTGGLWTKEGLIVSIVWVRSRLRVLFFGNDTAAKVCVLPSCSIVLYLHHTYHSISSQYYHDMPSMALQPARCDMQYNVRVVLPSIFHPRSLSYLTCGIRNCVTFPGERAPLPIPTDFSSRSPLQHYWCVIPSNLTTRSPRKTSALRCTYS